MFRSQSVEPGERWVIGYDEVEAEIGSLTTLLRSVDTLSIPILLRPQSQAALDGEVFEFAVHGGFGCAVRFSWTRGEVPEGWKRMVELVEAAIRSFDVLDIVAKP
ncbi:MAG: hypothetical protein R3B70_05835 [Polyangiaceae bacterium]